MSRFPRPAKTQQMRGRAIAVAVTVAGIAGLAVPNIAAAATPGSLDPTFGSAGVASMPEGTRISAVADAGSGKVVVVGQTGTDAAPALFLARLDAAGNLDASFGTNGIAQTGTAGSGVVGNAVAVGSDGSVITVGTTRTADTGLAPAGMTVSRFTTNGSVDTAFGSGGVARTQTALAGDGRAVAVAPDGRILVGGSSVPANAPSERATIVRLTPTGALDTAYANGGARVLNVGLARINAVAAAADGSAVVVGRQQDAQPVNSLIAKLDATGAPASGFGNGGVVVRQYARSAAGSELRAVNLRPDGGIIAAGYASHGTNDVAPTNTVVVRLGTTGAPVADFGTNGAAYADSASVNSPAPSYDPGAGGVALAGEQIYTGGTFSEQGTATLATAAFDANGTLVSGYGIGGQTTLTTDRYASPIEGHGIVACGPGVVVAGTQTTVRSTTSYRGVVARYGASGALPACRTITAPASSSPGTSPSGGSTRPPAAPGTPGAPAKPNKPTQPGATAPTLTTPRLSGARLSPSTLRRTTKTKLRFTATDATAVRLSVERRDPGRVKTTGSGKKRRTTCAKPTRTNKKARACTRWTSIAGSQTVKTASKGLTTVTLTRKIAGRTLPAGRYRLVLIPRDAKGRSGTKVTVALTVTSR